MLGGGSSLVGGTLKTEILREEVLELALDGFLPVCDLGDRAEGRRAEPVSGAGPAVCFRSGGDAASGGVSGGRRETRVPDAILFNGGFFIPEILRQRVADVMEHWYGQRPLILENRDLDLAVAVGAAYYSYVRSTGRGCWCAGDCRALTLSGWAGTRSCCGRCAWCRAGPKKGRAGDRSGESAFGGEQAGVFPLVQFAGADGGSGGGRGGVSTRAGGGRSASACAVECGDAVRQSGRAAGSGEAGRALTEVGTLEIWADSKESEHRWRLQFELRKAAAAQAVRPAAVISEEALAAAELLIPATFVRGPVEAAELPAQLEQALGLGRNSWPLSAIRKLADRMLELAEARKRSAAHELRWLNLCGFCLRPGFGFPGDDFRIEQARRVYAAGLTFANQVQNEIEWWIFWGRVAGGLNKNQQTDIFQRLSPTLLPRGSKKPQRVNPSLLREMWRAAAVWNCCRCRRRRSWGMSCWRVSRRTILSRRGCGVWRGWARGNFSTGRLIKCCRRRRRRGGWSCC